MSPTRGLICSDCGGGHVVVSEEEYERDDGTLGYRTIRECPDCFSMRSGIPIAAPREVEIERPVEPIRPDDEIDRDPHLWRERIRHPDY
jgi:hypothetical protein